MARARNLIRPIQNDTRTDRGHLLRFEFGGVITLRTANGRGLT
jgi:hypothetical protein